MDNYELLLTEQAQENIEDTLATLITAAQEIASASQKDFEKIKAKKWYKRLWELVTFNNDNQKIQARGVGNLAKLNEITMKAIVLVSKQSKDIAEKVHESLKQLQQLEDDVSDLYEQQIKIISVVQKIKRGFETEERFDELSQNQRDIIFAVLHTYALEKGSNDDTGKLLATLRGQAHDTYANVNYDIIETELTPSSQKILYTIIHAYSLLLTGEFANEDHEMLQYIRLSGNEKKEIRNRVKNDISIYGKDEYIKFFDAPTEEYDFDVDANDIVWNIDESDDFEDNNIFVDEETNSDYSELFELIRSKIGDVFLEEKEKSKIKSQLKRQKKYHEKYIPQVIPKTIIAVADLVMVQVIFTTSGIHIHRSLWNDCVYAKYADINTSASTIDHKKNILHLLKADKTEFFAFESSASFFDCSKFLELIDEIKALNTSATDCPIAIADMSEEIKLAYGKALVCFSNLTKCQLVDAIRIIHDLKISDDTLHQLRQHIDLATYQELLLNLKGMLPYPSEENACYSLIQDMAVLIQYSSGRCCDITGEEDKIIGIAVETLGIDANIKRELIPVAQINYRILKKDITKKEMDKLGQRLKDTASQVGISLAVVSSTSALLINHLWFWFIPSFGAIVGIASATLSLILRKKADKDKMDSEYERIYKLLEDSYAKLYRTLSNNCSTVQDTSLIYSLKLSAERTNKNIKESLDNIQ